MVEGFWAISFLLSGFATIVGLAMLPFKMARQKGEWTAAIGGLGIVLETKRG
jgi:hypothetical protein